MRNAALGHIHPEKSKSAPLFLGADVVYLIC